MPPVCGPGKLVQLATGICRARFSWNCCQTSDVSKIVLCKAIWEKPFFGILKLGKMVVFEKLYDHSFFCFFPHLFPCRMLGLHHLSKPFWILVTWCHLPIIPLNMPQVANSTSGPPANAYNIWPSYYPFFPNLLNRRNTWILQKIYTLQKTWS